MRKYGLAILRKNYHKRFSFIVKLEKYIKYLDKYIKSHQRTSNFYYKIFGISKHCCKFFVRAYASTIQDIYSLRCLG